MHRLATAFTNHRAKHVSDTQPCVGATVIHRALTSPYVAKTEMSRSRRLAVVIIEHSTEPFAAVNGPSGCTACRQRL